jgi:hypothetical protein
MFEVTDGEIADSRKQADLMINQEHCGVFSRSSCTLLQSHAFPFGVTKR